MRSFEYYRPRDLEEALKILDQNGPGVTLLSGGTNVLVDWRSGIISPKFLMDIFHLRELRFIEDHGDLISIGSTTTMKAIASSSTIRSFATFLGEAASQVGSPQVRNRATIGGNIVSASPAADTLPPLLVLETTLCLKSLHEERQVSLASFLRGAKATGLRDNEILVSIRFPKPSAEAIGRFVKFGRRNALAISVVNIALLLVQRNGVKEIGEARVALGAVGPKAFRVGQVEDFLFGKTLEPETIREAAEMAAYQCRPISDIRANAEGRRKLVKVLLEEVLSQLACS